tara:strand:- start:93 stop:668 length:576 start_codon:yes stop_codon:yes gene_type:complete
MDKSQQNIVFNQFLDNHQELIISRIKRFHNGDIINDHLQDVLIKFYHLIPKFFYVSPEIFNSSSWIVTVVDNYLRDIYRSNNAKRKLNEITVSDLNAITCVLNEDHHFAIKWDVNSFDTLQLVIDNILMYLSKKDRLVLLMKYYYGKSSEEIEQRLKIKHVNVRINRIKKKIQKEIKPNFYLEISNRFFAN